MFGISENEYMKSWRSFGLHIHMDVLAFLRRPAHETREAQSIPQPLIGDEKQGLVILAFPLRVRVLKEGVKSPLETYLEMLEALSKLSVKKERESERRLVQRLLRQTVTPCGRTSPTRPTGQEAPPAAKDSR